LTKAAYGFHIAEKMLALAEVVGFVAKGWCHATGYIFTGVRLQQMRLND
jgi:hypothetical protein